MDGVFWLFIIIGVGAYLYDKYIGRVTRLGQKEFNQESVNDFDFNSGSKGKFEIQVMPTIYTPLNILDLRWGRLRTIKEMRRIRHKSKYIYINNVEINAFDGIWSDVGKFYNRQELEKYYDFLEDIRMIVEDSSLPVDVKINDIIFTCKQKSHYKTYFQKLNEKYDSFPACLFYKELTEINGIGDGTALDLFNSGFLTLKELENASDEQLLEVPGVGKKTVKQINNHFNNQISL